MQAHGRWVFLCEEGAIPDRPPFDAFCERHLGDGSGSGGDGAADAESILSSTWHARAGVRPDGAPWPHMFELVAPAYARSGAAGSAGRTSHASAHGNASARAADAPTAEDELLGPWLWDARAQEDGEAPQPAPPPAPPPPRRRALVYLDDFDATAPPGDLPHGLSIEQRQVRINKGGRAFHPHPRCGLLACKVGAGHWSV